MKRKDFHIAIAGGGLVGCLLSLYLRKRGYRVTVYERRPDMRKASVDGGRSINLALSARGIAALEEQGLSDVIRHIAIPMHGRMMHDPAENLTFQPYGKDGQYINSVSRADLNIVLMDEAEKNGVEFNFEHRCVQVDVLKTEVTWQTGASSDQLIPNRYDLVIGADGAFSAVRSSLQFTERFNFSQYYIEHGYKELHIPAGAGGSFQIERNALHIWPRESFMMIALPNPDGTFTCTLFLPFEGDPSFNTLHNDEAIQSFFRTTFPDAARIMPSLLSDFQSNPTSSLVTMKCFPWARNRTLLIGDAAHAVVPFYGQGMNAGFEDCRILNSMLDQYDDNWEDVLKNFQRERKPDADAIADLALENFIEMRDLVADDDFLLRKRIEARIHDRYPEKWIPQYSMVTFRPDIRYSTARAMGKRQASVMDRIMASPQIHQNWETLDLEKVIAMLEHEEPSGIDV